MVHMDVTKYSGYTSSVSGEEVIPPRIVRELARQNCTTCKGKGVITTRCRCNGTGRVRDMELSRKSGLPIDKECERCSGKGFKRSPGTVAFRAVKQLIPELQERTWNNNWRPFFERLVAKCDIEENHADSVFREVTK